MLVEDDNNLREIYEARLAAEGYEIVSAQDGEEALALAVKERPDLIIADVMMPKVSGFDMLDILRSTPETKHSKIIMMTALSQAEDKARAEKLGADRYLVKSQVTLEDVVKVAGEILNESGAPPAAATAAMDANPVVATPVAPAEPATSEPPASVSLPTPVDPSAAPVASPPATPAEPSVTPAPAEPTASPPPTAQVASAPMPVVAPPDDTAAASGATQTPAPEPTAAPTEPAATPTEEAAESAADENSVSSATQEATASKQIEEFIAGNPTLTTSAESPKDDTAAAPEQATDTTDPAEQPPSAPEATEQPAAETPAIEVPSTEAAEPTGLVEEVITTPSAGAPTATTAPAPTKTTIPVTIADDEPAPATATTLAGGSDADQTMAKAVEGLLGSNESTTQPAAPTTTAAPVPADQSAEDDSPQLAKKRGGERVITPLSDPRNTGPDLNELLAKEEANADAAPLAVNSVISPDGTINSDPGAPAIKTESFDASPGSVVQAPPTTDETPTSSDPNNIAL